MWAPLFPDDADVVGVWAFVREGEAELDAFATLDALAALDALAELDAGCMGTGV